MYFFYAGIKSKRVIYIPIFHLTLKGKRALGINLQYTDLEKCRRSSTTSHRMYVLSYIAIMIIYLAS